MNITEALIDFFTALVKSVTGLLPSSDPPAWVADGIGYLNAALGYADGLGAWVPWSLVGTVISAVGAALLVAFLIKVVRIVASFFTAGGGSAA